MLDKESLKCCGNCVNRESHDIDGNTVECCPKTDTAPSSAVCYDWEFDGYCSEIRVGLY